MVDTEKQRLLSFKPGSVQPEPEGEFSNPDLGGIAWADGRFWSTDPEKGAIYQHGIDTAYSIRRSYPQPARHPFSIFSDGEYIWVGDSKTDEVYQYLLVRSLTGTSLTPLGRLQLPGIRPVAIHIAAGKLWALDGLSHKVFRYKLEASRAVALDSADLSHWLPLSRRLTGMALNNQAVWVTTADPVELHRIEAQSLRWKK
ncbi:MAG: hypothetical protein A3J70_01015 [Elusimicrobia bacterium RIFCSPHIGHO2_02_FULL_61_10]|nr:MAG: hypothetical protein A3J70_01015 [Elusimicrobia bacterium RIFCSPHIGHO2_02_FULL_61_10]